MNVFLVGRWDGVNLWLQWDGQDAAGYQVEIRFRAPGAADWEAWRRVGGLRPVVTGWMVIPTHREGWAVQARVAVLGTGAWVDAAEAEFNAPSCQFEFSSRHRTLHYLAGTEFHAIVDGHAAYYRLDEEVEVPAAGSVQASLRACDPSGYHQLDRPGHFVLRPALGLTIANLAPSENDLRPTGRGFTELARIPRQTPVRVVFGKTCHFDGCAAP